LIVASHVDGKLTLKGAWPIFANHGNRSAYPVSLMYCDELPEQFKLGFSSWVFLCDG